MLKFTIKTSHESHLVYIMLLFAFCFQPALIPQKVFEGIFSVHYNNFLLELTHYDTTTDPQL